MQSAIMVHVRGNKTTGKWPLAISLLLYGEKLMKKYMPKLLPEIIVRIFFYTVYAVAIAALPYIIKEMIDHDYAAGDVTGDIIRFIALFISCILIGMLAQYITQRMAWQIECHFKRMVREDLFRAFICKPPRAFYEKDIGEYTSMLDNDVDAWNEYFEHFLDTIEAAIGLCVYAIFIFSMDIKVAIVIYIFSIMTLFLPKITGKKLAAKKDYLLNRNGCYISKVNDLLQGYGNVTGDTWKQIAKRHEKESDKLEKARFSFGSFKTFANVLNGSVMYMIDISAFVVLIVLLAASQITAGVATATVTYIREFSYPLRMVIDSISAMKSVSGVRRKLLAEIVQQYPRGEGITFLKEIQYQDVSVKYENFALQHFSYCFEKGKKYAIIGENGSGKSTILKLLLGYIVPDTGSVTVDEQNLSRIDATSFIAYIAQDDHIYAEKFMDNVTMFGSYAQDVYLTVKDWKMDESLARIEEKEDCSLLSGGEKQIVSFLRGLLSSREVLVLDEPFSAVDEQKELQLTDWLLSTDKTVLMVTHNVQPQFLNKFDAVLCMENGRLVS